MPSPNRSYKPWLSSIAASRFFSLLLSARNNPTGAATKTDQRSKEETGNDARRERKQDGTPWDIFITHFAGNDEIVRDIANDHQRR